MSRENVEVVRRAQAAINRRDAEALGVLMSPECEITPLRAAVESTVFRGPDAAAKWFAAQDETGKGVVAAGGGLDGLPALVSAVDHDIRFLPRDEVEALLRAVPDDLLGPTDGALYLTAAMTGLRQGELVALRWRDVAWPAGVVRVRRSFSRGAWTTPKSRHAIRAVPLPDRVAGEIERHYQRSAYQGDDELVFAHPQTGKPYDASKMRVRFKGALQAAGLRDVRFHDLRHTYGTAMVAAGAPLRTLQGWMGHRDYKTTEVYADFAPDPSQGAAIAERAFGKTGRGAETEVNTA